MILTLATPNLLIRSLNWQDLDALAEIIKQPTIYHAVSILPECNHWEFAQQWIERSIKGQESQTEWLLGVDHKENLIGNIALHGLQKEADHAELGYWLAPAAQGKGYMLEACKALCAWAFSESYFSFIIATCATSNIASQRLLLKLGMKQQEHTLLLQTASGEERLSYLFKLSKSFE